MLTIGGRVGRVLSHTSSSRVNHAQVIFDLPFLSLREDSREKATPANITVRNFHATQPAESGTILAVAFGVASTAYAASHVVTAYENWQNKPEEEKKASDTFYARNYYDGPFEDKMTRREAALILGVRESANKERIRVAHRKLAILNHPDKGGSTFISGKVNEAKELLLKTATDD